MTIEVKYLVIKSTVQSGIESSAHERQIKDNLLEFREELITECREMVAECIRESAER
ncbi:hypothetical protein MNBD_GAMMA16-1522 [hydrothermal vent metagenome]|uniref:Uncharacterized protein n=1 Tax=hydrothermal vent metagenome TaxID=652676 RepID=A0A3B0YVW2_9ZZZZ